MGKLGEYRGRILTQEQFDKLRDSSYVFEKQLRVGSKMQKLYVDARAIKHSNWTRYVNGAKTEDQQKLVNTECYQYGGKLWYRTTKEVLPGQELIIDYGDEYWSDSENDSESSDAIMSE